MKNKLILALVFLVSTILISFGQNNPPPDKTTNDEMIRKSVSSYSIVNNLSGMAEDDPVYLDSVLVCITFVYTYKDVDGVVKKISPRLDGYHFRVYQTFTKNMIEYPKNNFYIWRATPFYINDVPQPVSTSCGLCQKPAKPMFITWILFKDTGGTGNIKTGNVRVGK